MLSNQTEECQKVYGHDQGLGDHNNESLESLETGTNDSVLNLNTLDWSDRACLRLLLILGKVITQMLAYWLKQILI